MNANKHPRKIDLQKIISGAVQSSFDLPFGGDNPHNWERIESMTQMETDKFYLCVYDSIPTDYCWLDKENTLRDRNGDGWPLSETDFEESLLYVYRCVAVAPNYEYPNFNLFEDLM